MKPLYNSTAGRVRRPRKTVRQIGVISRELKREVEKYSITKMAVGLTLLSIGVDVVALSLK